MNQFDKNQKKGKLAGFLSRLFSNLDKNLKEKAKNSKCCCNQKPEDKSCCS